MQVQSLGWEDPLEEGVQPAPVFLPGESHGQRSLVGYSPWGCKELDTTEQLTFSLKLGPKVLGRIISDFWIPAQGGRPRNS